MGVEIPDYEILSAPNPKPRNTRYTGRASMICAKRGGHDWGRVPVLRQTDPRGGAGGPAGFGGFRPGDVCATCGRHRRLKIDWDQEQRVDMAYTVPRKYQDRSKYTATGRINKGARRGR